MDDMQSTWTDTVSEILSFLTYGWSYHEIVYKRRSGEQETLRRTANMTMVSIGWRNASYPITGFVVSMGV